MRKLKVENEFYVSDKIIKSKNYRFMHLFNFKNGKFISDKLDKNLNATLIHWLPVLKDLIKTEILLDNGKSVRGVAEKGIKKLKVGDLIQFERFGFVRLDKKYFIFTHK